MRSVRIVSDGTPKGTHIYDAATGEKLEGIQSVKLELSTRGTKMRATLTEKARVDEVLITEAAVEEQQAEPASLADLFASWGPATTQPTAGSATYTVNTCCNGGH